MRASLLRKCSWIVLAAVMILSNVFGYLPSTVSAANADGSLTVAEAIANNSGTGTVEGYIVGHATGSLSANFQAPFSNDFNFLIADSANEQNKTKLLDVQLTTAYRGQFGLQSNPSIIGKKVKITGTLSAYNSFPGLKSPTSLSFMDNTTPQDPPQTVISIANAKKATGTVTIAGIVTADNSAIGGGKLSTYVQDNTGGINIFSSSAASFPDLKEGDQIQVTGTITSYKDLTEISPTSILITAHNQAGPSPVQVTIADLQDPAKAEQYEGQLVHMTGYFKIVPATPAGGGYNIQVVDQQFNGTTVRIIEGSMDMAAVQQDKWYEVTGILGQYTTYQVIPRKASDVVLSANQPPLYPTQPGDYEATVARVVDGDTIALQSPVLGATNVRFLNIDTPESDGYINLNGGVKTPADQNQLDFGLAAKHYMETLLAPGDKVVLKIGEEATDHYGRLLAQVVRKSDNLNVNLDMVNKGYAVTYFIWPIGTIDEYNMYQTAVKTAKDQALSIWNPANPLQELPFVFRARLSGEGLTRPVGNSDTKIYVDKEQWASVKVEKRIFFNTEADAIANGYSKAGQITVPPLPDGTGKKVLFDNTHGQTAGAADWVIDGGFSDFADGLRAAGFTVDALERAIPYTFGEQAVTYDKLKKYDVFIIGEANIPYKKSEQDAMLQYVKDGGSIFFIADHYNADRNKNRWDASEVMNGYRRGAWDNLAKGMSAEEAASAAMQGVVSSDWLGQNFGVRFRYNALGDVNNLTDVVTPDQSFGITAGVNSVAMHAGSTLAILDPTKAKGLVYVPTSVPVWANAVDSGIYSGGGRAEGPFTAVSKLGAGKAAFIGDSSPVEDATPKYLREENGAKKTTYDGFKGEANDAAFLVHTVEWLANHESYTNLAQVAGLQLDQPTQLLAFENPVQSTEPKPEPWAAPDAGYKWYDPSTFKAGSYGSTQQQPQPVPVPVPEKISIADARLKANNTLVTVEGVITSEPGAFGSQGFYVQDETAGIFVFQSTAGYHAGDMISISAKKTVFNTELELTDPVVLEKIGTAALPEAIVQPSLSEDNQGRLVKLEYVTIQNYKPASPTGSFEFDAVNGSGSTQVRVDVRSLISFNEFQTKFPAGALVHITGISSIFKGTYQLKPLTIGAVELVDVIAPTATVAYSTTAPTNKDVAATITPNEAVTVTNNGGSTSYTFADNGSFTFEFIDAAGNKGSAKATVANIDKVAPTATVAYSTTAPTNQDVVATITPSEPVTVTNNGGSTNYTFSENGSFTFEFIDAAGNKGTAIATVANIDKVAPTATVAYSATAPTNQDVVATITPSEPVTVTNNGGSTNYTFSENGSFTFEFIDTAGNKGSATATVSNIDKIAPTLKLSVDKPMLEENNHKMVPINVTVQADGTGSGIASVVLTSISSNEPDNGLGDGDTVNDIQDAAIGIYDTSFSLRAERSGKGSGRTYTITYTATDLAGNTTTALTLVVVPNSKGNNDKQQ